MDKHEVRVLPLDTTPVEVRQDESGTNTLVGYGAVFGKFSQDLGGFREVIDPKAFNRTVQNQKDVLVTFNHDVNMLLGRTGANTARINVDEVGVRYEVDLPDTETGRSVAALAQRGDLFGSSFTFSVPKGGDSWDKDEDGRRVRTLNEVRLYELGPVVSPAYLDTSVAVRALEAQAESEAEVEDAEEEREAEVEVETPDSQTLNPAASAARFIR